MVENELLAVCDENMVGFVFTNYNNSQFTIQALQSIFASPAVGRCFVVVVDNCSTNEEVKVLLEAKSLHANIRIVENRHNVGYFRGLNVGIEYLRSRFSNLSTIVVGNNDLVFPVDFIGLLDRNKHLFEKYPVISPDIVTLDGVHQNPHVIMGTSRFREFVWDAYFSNYYLARAISRISAVTRRLTERKDYHTHKISQPIYQGYGACYILTKCFFGNFELLWAPTFLMGEEFFLAKQIESKGYRVFYEPDILVRHHDHAAVSKLPSRKLWEITKRYHKIYRKFITPYKVKMVANYRYPDCLLDCQNESNE